MVRQPKSVSTKRDVIFTQLDIWSSLGLGRRLTIWMNLPPWIRGPVQREPRIAVGLGVWGLCRLCRGSAGTLVFSLLDEMLAVSCAP